jgi:hypothetical protein
MDGWVDQCGSHANQFYLVVTIAMPMLFYRFQNLLKWTQFLKINLNIYMVHKIILQNFKNRKSHELLNPKLMDYTFNFHFYVDYATIH